MTPSSLHDAIARHQRGELDQASQIYRRILTSDPNHADALHLLGLTTLQRGQPKQAIELIERAIAIAPSEAVFHGNLAEAYRANGQLKRAVACYQVALRLQPASANVAFNFGSLFMQMNRPSEAANLFRQCLKYQPNSAQALNGLGNAYRLLGDIEQALKHFRRAVEVNPQAAFAHTNLGQLLLDLGQPKDALPHCREAVRLQPQSAPVHNNLGNALRRLGELTEAKACYTEALRLEPNLGIVHNNLGQVMVEEDRLDEALRWFNQAVELEPKNASFRVNLAGVLRARNDYDAAEKQLRAAHDLQPRNPDVRFALGKLRYDQGRLEEAQAEYRALLESHPDHPYLNHALGEVLLELNHQDEAMACFRATLRKTPNYAPSLTRLATHLRDKLPAEEREALRRLAADPKVPDPDRSLLLFGLAHVCDAEGAYEEAAQHLHQANALELAVRQQRGQGYNLGAHVSFMDQLRNVFTAEFFERVRGFGVDSERPIFIVGLPRSGTTLLEQVLASHSKVFGAGELRLSRENFELLGSGSDRASEDRALAALQTIDADGVRWLAQTHLQRLDALNSTASRVTDKMPDNYMYLGFLAMQFPKAHFLHCRRDPRDVAVSCWITQFKSIPWANDPEHMASRFAQYQRLMEHWERVLPVPVMHVDYEDMVEDLEEVARRVLDFCGLEWEPACLDFHRTRRPVRTASLTQVRQPIYRRSLARWRNYEKALQPLFDQLAASLEPVQENQPVG